MGLPMAANLAKKGHELTVFDVSADSVNAAVAFGAEVGKHARDVAERSEVVVTMLPSSPHVRSVYNDAETGIGAASNVSSLLCIDASTIEPAAAREVSQAMAQRGARMVDAPVSGGVGGATNGTLTFMVGGEQAAFDDARGVLECMGANIVHCGASGNGQVVKVCNNLVLGITMIGVSEAMNLGQQLGMDASVMASIFNTSSARCWVSDTYNPVPGVMEGVPASNNYRGGFGAALMAKDLGLAVAAAHDAKVPLPLGGVVQQFYNMMCAKGNGGRDFGVVYEFLSKRDGA